MKKPLQGHSMKPKLIKYVHLRYAPTEDQNEGSSPFSNFGGATLAYYFTEHKVHISLALCSINDPYCRKTGREIAKHRLLNKAPTWYMTHELPGPDIVEGYDVHDIIDLASNHWPHELETWAIDFDVFETDKCPAHEKTMPEMCCAG